MRYRDVWAALGRRTGRPISPEQIEAAVNELTIAGLVELRDSGAEPKIYSRPKQGTFLAEEDREPTVPAGLPAEAELMGPVEVWLRDVFLRSFSGGAHAYVALQNTSRRGPFASGVWSRPDFVVARVRRHRFSSERSVDLYGFELKRADRGKIISVHEALAHTRFVHFSYLVWHMPNNSPYQDGFEDIRGHCAMHGIGLIVFGNPSDPATFSTELDPNRKEPDQTAVDEFIQSRFDEVEIANLEKAVRTT